MSHGIEPIETTSYKVQHLPKQEIIHTVLNQLWEERLAQYRLISGESFSSEDVQPCSSQKTGPACQFSGWQRQPFAVVGNK